MQISYVWAMFLSTARNKAAAESAQCTPSSSEESAAAAVKLACPNG
jgi:hypothetical protein